MVTNREWIIRNKTFCKNFFITYSGFFRVSKVIEEISTYISANEPKLEKLLGTGAKNLLHPNSRCYLVTEELWKVIGKTIWEEAISALKSSDQSQEISQEYLKDWGILKILYTQKILMVEAS